MITSILIQSLVITVIFYHMITTYIINVGVLYRKTLTHAWENIKRDILIDFSFKITKLLTCGWNVIQAKKLHVHTPSSDGSKYMPIIYRAKMSDSKYSRSWNRQTMISNVIIMLQYISDKQVTKICLKFLVNMRVNIFGHKGIFSVFVFIFIQP